MEWLGRKLDTFLAAVVIAVAAISAWQGHAFMNEYLNRLGHQLGEARSQLSAVQTGLRYKLMSETVRGELEASARERAQNLQAAYDSVANTNILVRPIALARNGDPTLLKGTWSSFSPTLPLSGDAIAYTVIGMVLGFVAYEIVKFPLVAMLREPRRRKFRKRS